MRKTEPRNIESKIGAPDPRSNHTATYVPYEDKVYVFGGHGGVGYERKTFDDLFSFDCKTEKWSCVSAGGVAPKPRGSHTACLLPCGKKIFIYGGWSSITQFNTYYIFDTEKQEWVDLDAPEEIPRWNHSAVLVPALPEYKLFVFGGSRGDFEEGSDRHFGEFLNKVTYMDIEKKDIKSKPWNQVEPLNKFESMPLEREKTAMVYDRAQQRLIMFGGWANTYLNDLYELNISSVTGPEYAIYGIEPEVGPFTGGTIVTVFGEGFRRDKTYTVTFKAGKKSEMVSGIEPVTDDEEEELDPILRTKLSFRTPSFIDAGPQKAEVRVSVDGGDETLSSTYFSFFYNTKPNTTLAFGPAITVPNKPGIPSVFYIQARNIKNENRTTGRDDYRVEVYQKKVIEEVNDKEETIEKIVKIPIENEIIDNNNGQYEVKFQYEEEGELNVDVLFADEKGEYFNIRGAPFKAKFSNEAPATNNEIKGEAYTQHIKKKLSSIEAFIKNASEGISTENGEHEKEVKGLLKIKNHLGEIEATQDQQLLELEVMEQALRNLSHGSKDKKADLEKTKKILHEQQKLLKKSKDTNTKIKPNIATEGEKSEIEIKNFEDRLRYKLSDIRKYEIFNYDNGVEASMEAIHELEEEIEGYEKELEDYRYFAKMFELAEGPDGAAKNLEMIKKEKESIKELWVHIKKCEEIFNTYKNLDWSEIRQVSKEEGDINTSDMADDVKALNKRLNEMSSSVKKRNVFAGISKVVKQWMSFLPLIGDLKDASMTVEDDRHWNKVKEQLGTNSLDIEDAINLGAFWEFELYKMDVKAEIEEITENAKQERKIELNLKKVDETWTKVEFERVPLELKDGSLETLKVKDDDLEKLEEDQLIIQNMSVSKYSEYFMETVLKWQKNLSMINDTIVLLADVQKTWSFLINLFLYSKEVQNELPEYTRRFEEIDQKVKAVLENSKTNTIINDFANQDYDEDDYATILEALSAVAEDLKYCQKGLNDFIAGKRRVFPRFYFMTMEELLDILANGNNPVLLFNEKNYMNKIVQAGDKLEMKVYNDLTDQEKQMLKDEESEGRPKIVSMKSAVGVETLEFSNGGIFLKNKVEIYLQDVLKIIMQTLKDQAKIALSNFVQKGEGRKDWIEKNKAQLNLLVDNTMWVSNTEENFNKLQDNKADAMKTFLEEIKVGIIQMIQFVQSKLDKPLRRKIMCLITIETHNRDIVDKLIKDNVRKADEFQWQSQLRFYYDTKEKDFNIRIADASLWYGYEYLGNGGRLVVTPLTDRIYVTATQALHLKMGCAPAGPAGTGKTETTKDLASGVGKSCYVFNCSPEMNYVTMGNIFKGLAASGCWGCFDEFNRLIPEVLSVCTVQFKSVLEAIKAGLTKFPMEDDEVDLDPTCGAFITMNPGYLGRAELPEGLKALFRPITVMVPDFELICENILMAEGFEAAKGLAKKFVTLYKLCADLLTPQRHYDWGLRAIKSVLVVAGTFKRAEPEIPEGHLLFRALRDFNYPKISQVDLGVFNGLLSDLFPGIEIERQVDKDFEKTVIDVVKEAKLTAHEQFILKVVQLSELLDIRHCVFVMGPPGSGKSTTWRMLANANTAYKPEWKTTWQDINPKCVSTENLYGYPNIKSKEWKNGLLSYYMQQFSEVHTDGKPKWIILDGDLDANWIESMNSVMDDNKLLTLANNGRIILKDYMKMLFEIRDLQYATLATVTRAGILYISDDSGYQRECLITSWLRTFLETHEKFKIELDPKFEPGKYHTLKETIETATKESVNKIVDWMRKKCKFVLPVSYLGMTMSLTKLLEYYLEENIEEILNFDDKGNRDVDVQKVMHIYGMCLAWAFGGVLTEKDGRKYRKEFSDWFRSEFSKLIKFPSKGDVYDYFVKFEGPKASFEEWRSLLDPKKAEDMKKDEKPLLAPYDPSIPMQNVTVPISETFSIKNLTRSLIFKQHQVLLIGNAGSGKTQLIKGLLKEIREDNSNPYYFSNINFNFFTDATYLETMLDQNLMKLANRYGPKKLDNKSKIIFFIDDLNMPKLDNYNTQTAIALLRQHMDYGHWYDISKADPISKEVIDTQVVTAMNPTSGSFNVNPRYQRHFWIASVSFPDVQSLQRIYDYFLKGHFNPEGANRFKVNVYESTTQLIKAAIGLHSAVVNKFRKTAANFHYEFNIRHLTNIFSGILRATAGHFQEPEKLAALWLHESERIYCDRLVSPENIQDYMKIASEAAKKAPGRNNAATKYFRAENPEVLLFTDFPGGLSGDRFYDIVPFDDAKKYIEEALFQYNEQTIEMKLVLFDDAIKHVCKISRILSAPGGHALLVGVGGSGKQSLTRLSAFMCNLTVETISVNTTYGTENLKEDLRTLYKKAGEKDDMLCFMLTDTHITNEKFLVYINDLLASGEIADLYTDEDKLALIGKLLNKAKNDTGDSSQDAVWNWYINRVKYNLHVTLCFSPVGDTFRTRARRFPGLVNCTVIDWFQPWPKQALLRVSQNFLSELELTDNEAENRAIIEFMPKSFEAVNKAAIKIYNEDRRHVHNTPKSFLELLKLFIKMLVTKRENIETEKSNYELGLSKLQETEVEAAKINEDLKVITVKVNEKKAKADEVAEVVGKEALIVEKQNKKAKEKEKQCNKKAADVLVLKNQCDADVKKLEPMVKEALEKVQSLDEKEVSEMVGYAKPPGKIGELLACVMYMFAGVRSEERVYDEGMRLDKKGFPESTEWSVAQKFVKSNSKNFVKNLLNFPKEIAKGNKVLDKNFPKIRPYLELEEFKKTELMAKTSKPAGGVLTFIKYMVAYYDAMKEMIPKLDSRDKATKEKEEADTELAEVQAQVKELNEKLDIKKKELKKANDDKDRAQWEEDNCNRKLDLATRLVNALGSEKVRWAESITSLDSQLEVIVGDVLLSSAFISYTGPFSKRFRTGLLNDDFITYFKKNKIRMSEGLDPVSLLVDDATTAQWNNQGLPSDKVSIENGAILTSSERYPLMIDPQLQGITWIKQKLKSQRLIAMRIGSKNYLNKIEMAVQDGTPVLLENMEEYVDPMIMPLIARNVIKSKGRSKLQFAGKKIDLHDNFRLYMQTKISNPNYPPEVQAEAALINFTVTELGLGDQLLTYIVKKERPDLAKKRVELVKEQNEYKIDLKTVERDLLENLTTTTGNFLENIELIEGLENSKKLSVDISEKVVIAQTTEAAINEASENYRPTAVRGALIFFLMNELYKMSSLYMYSLESFISVIGRAVDDVTDRLGDLKKKNFEGEEEDDEDEARPENPEDPPQQPPIEQPDEPQREEGEEAENKGEDQGPEADVDEEDEDEEEDEEEEEDEDEDEDSDEDGSNEDGDLSIEEPNPKEFEEEIEETQALTPRSLKRRVDELTDTITYFAFENVRRGLFEKHKLIYSTMLCFRIMVRDGLLKEEEMAHLITGKLLVNPIVYPESESLRGYVTEQMYKDCKALEYIEDFNGLCDSLLSQHLQWKKWFNSPNPEVQDLPNQFKAVDPFHKLMLIKIMRPDRVTNTLKIFVIENMGERFIDQPPFDMEVVFKETNNQTPIFFVLFPGVDPTPAVEEQFYRVYCPNGSDTEKEKIKREKFVNISMGQGQEDKAIESLEKAAREGTWVFFQNVHLMEKWMKVFERKLEAVTVKANEDFRCFVSSEPPPASLPLKQIIPEAVLQRCIKVANEAPSDLKANMRRAWSQFSQARIEQCTKPDEFKAISFGLCYFHAAILGRKKFGSQGWATNYNFNDGDLRICADVLNNYLDKYDKIPFKDLRYIYGEIMYGGHITDFWDRRTNNTYLEVLVTEKLMREQNLIPSKDKYYRVLDPSKNNYEEYKLYIEKLPEEMPTMFGMHANAEINFLTNQCEYTFNTIIDIQGGSGAGGGSAEGNVVELVRAYANELHQQYPMLEIKDKILDKNKKEKKETLDPNPYQIVCLQESERMNKLLLEISTSLEELDLGIQGALNMTGQMEELALSLSLNRVPGNWGTFYPSKKPLGSWYKDLANRCAQLDHWIDELELPISICISYLFNPMSFLTAIMQVTAREKGLPLDSMVLVTQVTGFRTPEDIGDTNEEEENKEKEEEEKKEDQGGAYIHGLFLEGASWEFSSSGDGYLNDQKPKELHPRLPVVKVIAVKTEDKSMVGEFPCPVYYTTFRGPTYIFEANLRMATEEKAEEHKWVLAGVAAIMSDDF